MEAYTLIKLHLDFHEFRKAVGFNIVVDLLKKPIDGESIINTMVDFANNYKGTKKHKKDIVLSLSAWLEVNRQLFFQEMPFEILILEHDDRIEAKCIDKLQRSIKELTGDYTDAQNAFEACNRAIARLHILLKMKQSDVDAYAKWMAS